MQPMPLYGRQQALNQLQSAFDPTCQDESSCVLIRGDAGVGKSYLVQHFIRSTAHTHVAVGKFDIHNATAYDGIQGVLSDIVDHYLTLPTSSFDTIIRQIHDQMGSALVYLTPYCPSIHHLVDDLKQSGNPAPSRQRIQQLMSKFLRIAAQALYPLTLVLDDVQWADDMSMQFLRMMCRHLDRYDCNMLLAGRPGKQTAELESFCQSMVLHPLAIDEVTQWLTQQYPAATGADYVARLIYSLTRGNPYSIQRMMEMMVEQNIITTDGTGQWHYHIGRVNSVSLPQDIAEMTQNRMAQLSSSIVDTLQIMTCLGNDCPLRTALAVNKRSTIDTLLSDSWLVQQNVTLYFAHDIIYEHVYNTLSQDEHSMLNGQIARRLLSVNPLDQPRLIRCLIHTSANDWNDQEIHQLLPHLMDAAQQALQAVDFTRAIPLLRLSRSWMMRDDDWPDEAYRLQVDVDLIRALYHINDFAAAAVILDASLAAQSNTTAILRLHHEQMRMLAYQGHHDQVMDVGRAMMQLWQCDVLDHAQTVHIATIRRTYDASYIRQRTTRPLHCGQSLEPLRILYDLIPSARIVGQDIFTQVLLAAAVLAAQQPDSPYALFGHIAAAYVLLQLLDDAPGSQALADWAFHCLDTLDNDDMRLELSAFYLTFVHHWYYPLRETLTHLESICDACIQHGNVQYFEYALASVMFAGSVAGCNIDRVYNTVQDRIRRLTDAGLQDHDFTRLYILPVLQRYVDSLKFNPMPHEASADEGMLSSSLVSEWFTILSQYLYGDIAAAYEGICRVGSHLVESRGHMIKCEVVFFSALIRMTYHRENLSNHPDHDRVMQDIAYLQKVTEYPQTHHQPRTLLAQALYQQYHGEAHRAAGLYNEGIAQAEAMGNHLLYALGNQLAARMYVDQPRLHRFYIQSAIEGYATWGAIGVARTMQCELPPVTDTLFPQSTQSVLDLIRQIAPMDSTAAFSAVLADGITRGQCDYGAVFIVDETIQLHYESSNNRNIHHFADGISLSHVRSASHKVIRYAQRIGEPIHLNGRPTGGIFAHDPYLQDDPNKHILCIPLRYMGVTVALFYLERPTHPIDKTILTRITDVWPALLAKCDRIAGLDIRAQLQPEKITSPLTAKEHEVLRGVAQGLSNDEIAQSLFVSMSTVKTHLNNIYTKLTVDNRVQAVVKAGEMRIL